MDVEERLQELYQLQNLQVEVLELRSECTNMFKENFKQARSLEMRNLANIEISLTQTKIKMPDPDYMPQFRKMSLEHRNLNDILQDQANTIEAIQNMGML